MIRYRHKGSNPYINTYLIYTYLIYTNLYFFNFLFNHHYTSIIIQYIQYNIFIFHLINKNGHFAKKDLLHYYTIYNYKSLIIHFLYLLF